MLGFPEPRACVLVALGHSTVNRQDVSPGADRDPKGWASE